MCRFNIHCSIEQVHDLIRRRNPMDLPKLLNDIRCQPCASPQSTTTKGFCSAVAFKDIRVVSDLRTCPGCRQGHRDGFHITKGDFLKLVGRQAFDWIRKLALEVKEKNAVAKEQKVEAVEQDVETKEQGLSEKERKRVEKEQKKSIKSKKEEQAKDAICA